MSRVGKRPVLLPAGVECNQQNGCIAVKGNGGTLTSAVHGLVNVRIEDGKVYVAPVDDSRAANAHSGTMRQVISNMVLGVDKGFERKLNLVGVGYKAAASVNKLNLVVGFSHPVDIVMPDGIKVETPGPSEIVIKGADRQRVGQIAAEIRAIRPPEPYKGKGIRYADERVAMKEVKKK